MMVMRMQFWTLGVRNPDIVVLPFIRVGSRGGNRRDLRFDFFPCFDDDLLCRFLHAARYCFHYLKRFLEFHQFHAAAFNEARLRLRQGLPCWDKFLPPPQSIVAEKHRY